MTLAHFLGLSRLPLLVLTAFVLIHTDPVHVEAAAAFIVAAMISDMADGMVARKQQTVSDFGATLDMTCDKIFVCPVLFLLAGRDELLLWFATVITVREFYVMGLRVHSAAHGDVLHSRVSGKIKLCSTYAGILLLIFDVAWGRAVLGVAVLIAVWSAVEYSIHARRLFLAEQAVEMSDSGVS